MVRRGRGPIGMTADERMLAPAASHLTAAKPSWQDEVVFVCGKCMRKQREGVDGQGTSLRKWLRKALKKAGLKKRVRVIEAGCFDLCPKGGVTLVRGRDLAGARKPLRVLRSGDNPQCLLPWLRAGIEAGDEPSAPKP